MLAMLNKGWALAIFGRVAERSLNIIFFPHSSLLHSAYVVSPPTSVILSKPNWYPSRAFKIEAQGLLHLCRAQEWHGQPYIESFEIWGQSILLSPLFSRIIWETYTWAKETCKLLYFPIF